MKPEFHPRRRLLVAAAGLAWLAGCSRQREATPPAAASGTASTASATTSPRQAFETALRGTGFVVGQATSTRQALVFFDPQCPHCAALWKASQPLLDRIRMVWIPVAFVSPKSAPQGAMLLATSDPQALMDLHESRMTAGQGGLEVQGQPAADLVARIKANTELLQSLGANSVPHLIYRANADGPYGVVPGGLPTAELAKVMGL
ncbi:MAG TPA: thioredoxin fold domain-containing protein [Rubrivivax sp.]|nr:thioredoxin fold domain-containing protein [Rubrivivax sp.]